MENTRGNLRECAICEEQREIFAIITCMGYVCKECSEDITTKYKVERCVLHHLPSHFRLFVPDSFPPTDEEITQALVRAQENLKLQQDQLTHLEVFQKQHLEIYERDKAKIQEMVNQLEAYRLDGDERLRALHKNQKEEVANAAALLDQIRRIEEDVDMRRPFLESHHNQLHYPPRQINEHFVKFDTPYSSPYRPPRMIGSEVPIKKNLRLKLLRGSFFLPHVSVSLTKDFMIEVNGVRRDLEGVYYDTKTTKYPVYYRNCRTDFEMIVKVEKPTFSLREIPVTTTYGPLHSNRPPGAKGFLDSECASVTCSGEGVITVRRSLSEQVLTTLTINVLSFRQFVAISDRLLVYLTTDDEMMCHAKDVGSGMWPLSTRFTLPHRERLYRIHYSGKYFVLTLRPKQKDGFYQLAVVNVLGEVIFSGDIPFPFQITEVERSTKKFQVISKDFKRLLQLSISHPAKRLNPLRDEEDRDEEVREEAPAEQQTEDPPVFEALDEGTLRANADAWDEY
jgi:hypothetical protein